MERTDQRKATKTKTRRSAKEIARFLEEQPQSGLTIKAYCQANGISEKNFYRWSYKRRQAPVKGSKKQRTSEGGFACIELLQPTVALDKPSLFAEIGNIRLYKEVPAEYLKALLL